MRIHFLLVAVALWLTPWLSPAQEKTANPFRSAKVGDYVTYKQTTSFLGKTLEIQIKETVTAKNAKELTLRTTASIEGKPLPSHDAKIDLTRPYDPRNAAAQADPMRKFEKTGEGKEKVKIGDKTYDCVWIAGKRFEKDNKHHADVKIWFSKSVPLTGRVKVEARSSLEEVTTMEVVGWGTEK